MCVLQHQNNYIAIIIQYKYRTLYYIAHSYFFDYTWMISFLWDINKTKQEQKTVMDNWPE